MVLTDRRQEGETDHEVLQERLRLRRGASRHRDATARRRSPEDAHRDLTGRDENDGHPADLAYCGQRGEHPEDDEFVGERVQEGPRAGRAVAPGDHAVEEVRGGAYEPEAHEQPARRSGGDDERHHDRRGQQPPEGESVRGREQRRGPEDPVAIAHRIAPPTSSVAGAASRSGPSAASIRTLPSQTLLERARQRDDAVDVGGLAVRARRAGPVDEDLAGGAYKGLATSARDRVLQLRALAESLLGERGRDLLAEAGGKGALFSVRR